VIHRAVGDRDEAVVAPLTHEAHHLVGMHVALVEQRQHHHRERREPGERIGHGCTPMV
jgi:hypothetical protein